MKIAVKAAKAAGKILKKREDFEKFSLLSTDKDIKLQADVSAEKLIKKILQDESTFSILAEESGFTRVGSSDKFWVIDPLDGTANYARDIPLSCISISLVSEMNPILGVIYDFNNNNLYEGSIYSNAKCDGKDITVSNVAHKREGILITGLPNDTDYSNSALQEMIINFQKWRKVRMFGSAALASAYIASGRADLYMENKSYIWDVAAGAAIVKAAGGEALILNQNDKFQVDVRFSNSLIKT